MDTNVAVVCGSISTLIFVVGTLPMLVKAARTRICRRTASAHLAMMNLGNALNSVYVLSLPPGPVWALHGFNVADHRADARLGTCATATAVSRNTQSPCRA